VTLTVKAPRVLLFEVTVKLPDPLPLIEREDGLSVRFVAEVETLIVLLPVAFVRLTVNDPLPPFFCIDREVALRPTEQLVPPLGVEVGEGVAVAVAVGVGVAVAVGVGVGVGVDESTASHLPFAATDVPGEQVQPVFSGFSFESQ
jgi:hypothetical protein